MSVETELLIAAACVVIAYAMMRARSARKDPMSGQPRLSLAQQRQIEQELQDLLAELSEMSRKLSAELDTRAEKLERLIREAQEKIDALESAAPGVVRPPVQPPAPRTGPGLFEPRHAEVYNLADQGRSLQEIAKTLDRPSGEIELILALRPRQA
jgi:DNA-binding NarL/FixJ family response regulator